MPRTLNVLNSFGVTTIFLPPRVVSVLEQFTIAPANTYTSASSGLKRDTRLINAVHTRGEFPWAERYSHAIVGTRFQKKDLVRDL